MVEERRKARKVFGIMLVFLGVILLLILYSLLRTSIISNKVDIVASEVDSLFCTFERVQFDVEDVIFIATGEKVTIVNITVGTEFFQFYTYEASSLEFIDVGLLHWKYGQLLAFYSGRLEDGMNYVVEHGEIPYLNLYGVSDERTPAVKIYEIRQRNWFDDFVSNSSVEISALIGFAFVLTCCLFYLPVIEYYINSEIEKRIMKKKKRIPKKTTNV